MEPSALGSLVNWQSLLALLELNNATVALPASIDCPFCDGRMTIFQHQGTGGQWYSCEECSFAGDSIRFTSVLCQVSEPEVIQRLTANGLLPPISEEQLQPYIDYHVTFRDQVQQLWHEARGKVLRSPDAITILSRKHWRIPKNALWRTHGFDQIVGAVSVARCESLLCNLSGSTQRTNDSGFVADPRTRRIFAKNHEKKDVAVLCFHDLPNRISAFLFLSPLSDQKKTRDVFCIADPQQSANSGRGHTVCEAGLHVGPGVRELSTTFAFRDLEVAMRLQTRALSAKPTPLPIVVWYESAKARTNRAWQMLGGNKVVFWAEHLDIPTLRQAILTDGYICVDSEPEQDRRNISQYFDSRAPWEVLDFLNEQARPWPESLEQRLTSCSDREVLSWLADLDEAGEDLDYILGRCSQAFRDRLNLIRRSNNSPQMVQFDGSQIVCRDDKWFVRKQNKEELIVDAVLQLKEFIYYPKSGRGFYRGNVRYYGNDYPFMEDRVKLERDALQVMQSVLLQAKAGLLISTPRWSRKLVSIANRFGPAKTLMGYETVGYDRSRSGFVFPNFSIDASGQVKGHRSVMMTDAPAHLPKPRGFNPACLSAILQQGDKAYDNFWNLLYCFIGNVVAPVLNLPTRGLAVIGANASLLQSLSGLAGVNQFDLLELQPEKAREAEQKHNWPCLVSCNQLSRANRIVQFLTPLSGQPRNCILHMLAPQALAVATHGGWQILRTSLTKPLVLECGVQALIPCFLAWLAEKNFADLADIEPDSIRKQVGIWLSSLVGHHMSLPGTRVITETDHVGMNVLLVEVLYQMLLDGRINIVPKAFSKESNCLWRLNKGLFLPRKLLHDHVVKYRAVQPELQSVGLHLAHTSALIGETVVNDRQGWALATDWWNATLHLIRNDQLSLIKLA